MFHNILALYLFSSICLLPLISLLNARPTVEPPSVSFRVHKQPQLQGAWTHERNVRALSSSTKANLPEKRTPPGLTSPVVKMNMIKYTALSCLTPITSAARALEDFYSSIATRAAGPWQLEPRVTEFSIQEGNFALFFASLGDTIPWNFVKDMADKLWETACLGLTTLFDAMYMDDTGQIAVSVSMRIMDADGSLSSSSSDYREGSVPSVGS